MEQTNRIPKLFGFGALVALSIAHMTILNGFVATAAGSDSKMECTQKQTRPVSVTYPRPLIGALPDVADSGVAHRADQMFISVPNGDGLQVAAKVSVWTGCELKPVSSQPVNPLFPQLKPDLLEGLYQSSLFLLMSLSIIVLGVVLRDQYVIGET